MQGWVEGIQRSIDYIEQHLADELDIEEISAEAALSPFYYQRIFGALCGMTAGDYIRARRMTLAAQELVRTEFPAVCGRSSPARSKRCRIPTRRSGRNGCRRFRDTRWPENMTLKSICLRKKARLTVKCISGFR